MRESFVLHAEFVEDLPEEMKQRFLILIYDYGIKGVVPELEGLEKTVWVKIQRRIDSDQELWEETKQRRVNAGKRSAEARKLAKQNAETTEPKTEEKTTTDKNTVVAAEKSEIKSKRFVKPDITEIKDYIKEKTLNVDAERFFNYYESKGWKVGNAPMKNWKAALSNWAKNTDTYSNHISADRDNELLSVYETAETNIQTDVDSNLAEITGGSDGTEETFVF